MSTKVDIIAKNYKTSKPIFENSRKILNFMRATSSLFEYLNNKFEELLTPFNSFDN